MRRLSFLMRDAKLPPPSTDRRLEVYDPAVIQNRLNRSMRRRLSDDLANLIRKACLIGRADTADDLLTALHNLLDKESREFTRDRRITDDLIEGLTAEITAAKMHKRAA